MAFSDYDFALRFRNVIRSMIVDVLNTERPSDKVGRVVDIDRASGFAWIVYQSDSASSVRVKIYPAVQPQRSDRMNGDGNGSIVRVSGQSGARYISQVLNESTHQIGSRFVDPSFSSTGGSGDSTLRSIFSFETSQAPIPDGATWFPVATLIFPNGTGAVNVSTEMLGSQDCFIQRDTFAFDKSTARNQDLIAKNVDASSSGVSLATYYSLYDSSLDGLPVGWTSLSISYLRGTSSRTSLSSMHINLDCFGTDIQAFSYSDGIIDDVPV